MDSSSAPVEWIGARFTDHERAVATMLELRERFGLGPTDVAVGPLGTTTYDQPRSGTLLAGQFAIGDADAAVAVIQERGGEILERRSELPVDPATRSPR